MPARKLIAKIKIKVKERPLLEEMIDNLQECVVDQSLTLPDMCEIRIWDHDLEFVDDNFFDLGGTLEVSFSTTGESRSETLLFKGEITAIEPEFGTGNESLLVIRGYDKSWRGYRESKRVAAQDQKDSDVASKVAGNLGLSPRVDATREVFKQLFQDNQSDLEFLHERAQRIGYKVIAKEHTLYFQKAESKISEGPTLVWGENLVSFRPRLTAAEQVSKVKVQGWDPLRKMPIVGEANSSKTHPTIGYGENGPKAAASKFPPAELLVTDIPVQSKADADAVAAGHLDRINGNFVQAEGEAETTPEIAAGSSVKIENVGTKFSGTYHVTSVKHVYTSGLFRSYFTVQGNSTGTFAELLGRQEPIRRWHGIYPAIVTNNRSPDNDWGMVKVRFPWFDDNLESYWARLVTPGAGKERGFYLLPEVDDEVMVAFEQGDFNRPYVLGGLWNGKDKPPEPIDKIVAGGEVVHRIWKSRKGNYILLDDTKNKEKVEIVATCGHRVTFDDKQKSITIKSSSGVEISIDDKSNVVLKNAQDLTVSAKGNMSFDAKGNMKFDAKGNIDITAAGNLTAEARSNANFKGIQTTLEGTTKAELKSLTVSVSGSTLTEVKGALVKIN